VKGQNPAPDTCINEIVLTSIRGKCWKRWRKRECLERQSSYDTVDHHVVYGSLTSC